MNIVQYDIHSLFTSVIANPSSNPETTQIKNTTDWCPPYYDNGVQQGADVYNASCGGLKLGEYLWLGNIHVTVTMYQAIARGIAEMFSG